MSSSVLWLCRYSNKAGYVSVAEALELFLTLQYESFSVEILRYVRDDVGFFVFCFWIRIRMFYRSRFVRA